jgi:hypothetical protein
MALQRSRDGQQNSPYVKRDADPAGKGGEFFPFLGALNDQRLLAPGEFV